MITQARANSVSERHILPPLNKTVQANTTILASSDIDVDDKPVEAGENLTAGYVATIYTDGKAYHASPLYSDGKPALYFVVKTVSSGGIAFLRKYKLIPCILTGTTAGDYVYFRSGTPNISTTSLTTKSGSEDIQQVLGIVIEDDVSIQPLFEKAGQLL